MVFDWDCVDVEEYIIMLSITKRSSQKPLTLPYNSTRHPFHIWDTPEESNKADRSQYT